MKDRMLVAGNFLSLQPPASSLQPLKGIDGFLPFRGSLMLDVVATAMVVVLPLLAWSIYLVRARRRYLMHKRIQLALGAVLLVTVAAFEADIQINGWEHRAVQSPYYKPEVADAVDVALSVHLVFAVTTLLIWIVVIVTALRKFPDPPVPGPHSGFHKRWGWVAAIDMALTAVTGWVFYYLAFVA